MGQFWTKLETMFRSFEDQPIRVLMLGLDSAGKTTMLYKLKLDKIVKTIPTIGFNVETLTPCKGLTFTVWDVGGQHKLRRLWRHYFQDAGGLIYVVDSADQMRFKEARDELFGIINDEHMSGIPVLILANKQDMSCAKPIDRVTEDLGLHELDDKQPWEIQACSALKGEGIFEGLQNFAAMVKEHKKKKK